MAKTRDGETAQAVSPSVVSKHRSAPPEDKAIHGPTDTKDSIAPQSDRRKLPRK